MCITMIIPDYSPIKRKIYIINKTIFTKYFQNLIIIWNNKKKLSLSLLVHLL